MNCDKFDDEPLIQINDEVIAFLKGRIADVKDRIEKLNKEKPIEVQERQKRLLSMLLTVEVVKAFNEDIDKAKEILCDKEFYNEEVFDYYTNNGELLTAKQIGVICGVSEQSLSRTYKNFKEKLR